MWIVKSGSVAFVIGLLIWTPLVTQGTAQSSSVAEKIASIARGREVFNGKGGCTHCHRVGEIGSGVGPNLNDVGSRLTTDQLKNALLSPHTDPGPEYRAYEVVTRDGKKFVGKLLNQDPYSIQMLDSAGDLVAFNRSQVREAKFAPVKPMPSYRNRLTEKETDDLVAFLAAMRGTVDQ